MKTENKQTKKIQFFQLFQFIVLTYLSLYSKKALYLEILRINTSDMGSTQVPMNPSLTVKCPVMFSRVDINQERLPGALGAAPCPGWGGYGGAAEGICPVEVVGTDGWGGGGGADAGGAGTAKHNSNVRGQHSHYNFQFCSTTVRAPSA